MTEEYEEEKDREFYCISRINCVLGRMVIGGMREPSSFVLFDTDNDEDMELVNQVEGNNAEIGCFIEHKKNGRDVRDWKHVSHIEFSGEMLASLSQSIGGDFNNLSIEFKENDGICQYYNKNHGSLYCGEREKS